MHAFRPRFLCMAGGRWLWWLLGERENLLSYQRPLSRYTLSLSRAHISRLMWWLIRNVYLRAAPSLPHTTPMWPPQNPFCTPNQHTHNNSSTSRGCRQFHRILWSCYGGATWLYVLGLGALSETRIAHDDDNNALRRGDSGSRQRRRRCAAEPNRADVGTMVHTNFQHALIYIANFWREQCVKRGLCTI